MNTSLATPQTRPIPAPMPKAAEVRVLGTGIAWDDYLTLLGVFEDKGFRLYYLDGSLELMTVGVPHETPKKILARLIEALTEELDIEIRSVGSATLQRTSVARGAEPDESYYVTSVAELGRAMALDLEVTPPPDLVVEVEITSPLLDKLDLYAGLGVPELWRHDGRTLRVLTRSAEGGYVEASRSRAFPFLPLEAFARQVEAFDPGRETRSIRAFRVWVRDVVAPLHQP